MIDNKEISGIDGEIDRYTQVKKDANILFKNFIEDNITDQEFCNQFNTIIQKINELNIVSSDGRVHITKGYPMDLMKFSLYFFKRWQCFIKLKSRLLEDPTNEVLREYYKRVNIPSYDREFRRICSEYLNYQEENGDTL